jgi:hypothetical protein
MSSNKAYCLMIKPLKFYRSPCAAVSSGQAAAEARRHFQFTQIDDGTLVRPTTAAAVAQL